MTLFAIAAVVGFKSSRWIVVAALASRGVFDFLHGAVIENFEVPAWWAFCLAYDLQSCRQPRSHLINSRHRGLEHPRRLQSSTLRDCSLPIRVI